MKYMILAEQLFRLIVMNHDVKCIMADRFQLSDLYDWFDETIITSIGSDRLLSIIMPLQCKYGIDLEACQRYQYQPLQAGDTVAVVNKSLYDCETAAPFQHLAFRYNKFVYEIVLFNILGG